MELLTLGPYSPRRQAPLTCEAQEGLHHLSSHVRKVSRDAFDRLLKGAYLVIM